MHQFRNHFGHSLWMADFYPQLVHRAYRASIAIQSAVDDLVTVLDCVGHHHEVIVGCWMVALSRWCLRLNIPRLAKLVRNDNTVWYGEAAKEKW
jgi:hypothetical protein